MMELFGPLRWDDLRMFLAAAERGSFRAAAELIGCSMNTVRTRVETLERRLGVVLLTRSVGGVWPTSEGRELMTLARKMREIGAAADNLARMRRKGLSGKVRIGVADMLCESWLMPRLVEFKRAHPAIGLDVQCDRQPADVLRFERDLAIQLVRPSQAELVVTKLGTLHVMPFASDDYLRLHGIPASTAELAQHRVVELADNGLDLRLCDADEEGDDISIRTNSSAAHLTALVQGAGIGLLPTFLRNSKRKLRPVEIGVRQQCEIWLTFHPDVKRSDAISAAISWVKRCFDPADFPCFGDGFIHPDELERRAHGNISTAAPLPT